MWLDSEVGRGQHLRLLRPGHGLRPDRRSAPARPDDGPVVVVIEDDRRSLELVTLYLEGAGVRVVAAHDGLQGGWPPFGTTGRLPSSSTSASPGWTGGGCSRR